MHIALDMDDVILDFGGRVIQTVNKEYGTSLTLDDVTSWNLNELLDPILGEDWWAWWEEREWLWANADAIDGAIGAIRQLRKDGHFIEIVTASPRWAEAGKWQWLGKWKPEVQRVTMGPARPPMDKLAATNAQLIVDDKPETIREWNEAERLAILFNRPHNASATDLDRQRAFGWDETLDIIRILAREERDTEYECIITAMELGI